MELKRLLLSVISWSLTTLAAVGTSVSLLGAESESKDAPFTAVELAKKTEAFWNGVKSLDVKYVAETPFLVDESDEMETEKKSPRWLFDRATNRQRWITHGLTDEGIETYVDNYFDGNATYHFAAYDADMPMKSVLDFFIHLNETRRIADVNYGWNRIPSTSDNFPYSPWFPDGLGDENATKFFWFQFGDKELAFSEWVAKYPVSVPVRSVDEKGDVLWTFRVWNNPQTSQLFPVGTDETKAEDGSVDKEDAAQAVFFDVVINESKNYLLHAYRSVGFFPQSGDVVVSGIGEYKTLEYLSDSGLFFPKRTEITMIGGGKAAPPRRHTVEELRVNQTDLDLDSFTIPEFTPVSLAEVTEAPKHEITKQEIAIWGSDNKPSQIYTLEAFDELRLSCEREILKMRQDTADREKAERVGVRIVLCALGAVLIFGAFWLKRKRKTSLAEK